MTSEIWPALPFADWRATCATLHLWTQVVGKIRLSKTTWLNHSWHVVLYVTPRGLTTSPIYEGTRPFQIDFDFVDHRLIIETADHSARVVALRPCSVASFYGEIVSALHELDIETHISASPNEVAESIPFAQDEKHAAYDADAANRFWRVLVQSDRLFKEFRTRFIGKCSPVHFFWGSFDLAVTRFSGRAAPPHPGGVPHLPDPVTREAYSHEVSSGGFWPGGDALPEPVYYSYAYPSLAGFEKAKGIAGAAFFSDALREWVLPYEAVRTAAAPDDLLLDFLQRTYVAAADLAKWDRAALEHGNGPLLSPAALRN